MWRTILAALIAAFAHGIVTAQVIEIGEDGAIVHHDRPSVYLTADLAPKPIELEHPAPAPAFAPTHPDRSFDRMIQASAAAHGVSPDLVYSIAWHESRLRPDVVSSKGAIGLMQLMPATARYLGVDPRDPSANVEGGVTLLAQLLRRYGGDLIKALAAYDAGPAAVDRHGGIPPFRETRAYVADILEQLARRASTVENGQ